MKQSVLDEWLNIARQDWERVGRNLKDRDVGAAAFFLQQSLEKYLKAFLITHGWRLRKIHRLDVLLDDAVQYKSPLASFRGLCERASGYYLAERYPPAGALDLTARHIRKDLVEAKTFVKMLFPLEP